MFNIRSILTWTSLSFILLFSLAPPTESASQPKLTWDTTLGMGDDPYYDVILAWPWQRGAWDFDLSPQLRLLNEYGLAKFRLTGGLKRTRANGYDDLDLAYTHYRYPEAPYNQWNLGYTYKNSAQAWWNQGAKGWWRVKIKGEDKRYPDSTTRDYFGGEWEVYSESTQPLSGPAFPVSDFWSQTFFDYAVERALDGGDLFLDAWGLGELLLNEDEYVPSWARSEDELSTKLISRLSGGWSDHYNNDQYTWKADNYELQWQQQTAKESSLKLGLRRVEKTYPHELLKGYYQREHLFTWVHKNEVRRLEASGTYALKQELDGDRSENVQVWVDQTRNGSWIRQWKIQGRYGQGPKEGEEEAGFSGTYTLYWPKAAVVDGYLRVGAERDMDLDSETVTTQIRTSLSLARGLGALSQVKLRLESSRKWDAGETTDDWGVKIGLTRKL